MIPQRIMVRGFLCYREEQEICLESASLWLLAGLNGSGKSAIFDAVTYALFGGHRGGLMGAQALINKNSTSLAVEFDFLLDGQLYQARRTLKLNSRGGVSNTQQIRRWLNEKWDAVPDTSNKAGFDAWVRENIGLTYETFTSSVLLMQGKAEKLLAAPPKERFEVLAGIVDLSRYQKLHKRVDDRRRTLEDQTKTLQNQLRALPEVSEAEIQRADEQCEAAQATLDQAREEAALLQRLEIQAERWADLQARLADAESQWRSGEDLLADAAAIERRWERLMELRSVLGHLETAVKQRSALKNAEHNRATLAGEREVLAAELAQRDRLLAQIQQKRQAREREQVAEEDRRLAVADQLQALSVALVSLRHLHRDRQQLRLAQQQESELAALQQGANQELAARQAEQFAQQQELEAAREMHCEAEQRRTQTRTLFEEARKRAERFSSVVGEKICRYCGQGLTPGHVASEKAKLNQELAAVRSESQRADDHHRQVVEVFQQLEQRCRQSALLRDSAGRQVADLRHRQETARSAAARHADACQLAYQELAEPYRVRVSVQTPTDWLTTSFPSSAELADLERQRHALATEAATLQKKREARQHNTRAEQAEWDGLTEEQDRAIQRVTELECRLAEETVRCTACQENLERLGSTLPPGWQQQVLSETLPIQLAEWQVEKQSLERQGGESRLQQLRQAQANREALQRRRGELTRELAGIPEEARCPMELVRELHAQARERHRQREHELLAARQQAEQLRQQRSQRQQLAQQCLDADQQHQRQAILADLLGRNRLQLYLVRQAERNIVDHANAVLDRLSGGQLYLRLRGHEEGEASDQALRLECYNRTTGTAPIGVAFLSGSQRFRVAVSLALALGQYASRRHRPIESVIIDEGFGCLDRQGRQVMIQELQNLKGQLSCILLVSHQEEFAEAFPDGYRFELIDGTSVATRFER
jgi:DNA repair exonuclease SbcCD ATPase subunit